jgi:tetratricopeptide (TPR) repeat protein
LYARYLELVEGSENRVARNFTGAHAAEAFFKVGQIDRALAIAEAALELAVSANTPHHAALAQRVQAQIWMSQQKWDAAQSALDSAVATFESQGSRLELARALRVQADLLNARGDSGRAATYVERARRLFIECGAVLRESRTGNSQ